MFQHTQQNEGNNVCRMCLFDHTKHFLTTVPGLSHRAAGSATAATLRTAMHTGKPFASVVPYRWIIQTSGAMRRNNDI